MKVLTVISSLETGGAQKLTADLMQVLKKDARLQLKLVVFKNSDSVFEDMIKQSGIEIISLNTNPKSFKAFFRLIPQMKWADVVHAHLFPVNYLVALGNFIAGKKLVFTEHNTHNRRRNHKFLRPLEKFMYKRYANIGCISKATFDNLTEWIGPKLAAPRLKIIENGIKIETYNHPEQYKKDNFFGRKGMPLLMISRFSPAKDHASVLKALKYLERDDIFVVFAGEGETLETMKELAEKLHVVDKVLFLGNRNDVPALIANSKIGIQSSHWEGFGLTAFEMMAGGLPVIVSDVEGLSDLTGEAALKFPKNNAEILARQINQLLDNPDLYNEMIKKGKEKAEEFSIERMAEEYKKLYCQAKS